MEKITVMFSLPETTLDALRKIATDEDVAIEHVLQGAIKRDLFRRSRAKKAVRTDERLVAPLRALLAEDFAFADGWDDLQNRLRIKGYALREAGAGLALHRHACGTRMCKASDLGNSYARLMRRFLTPFPDHSHRYLPERVLG